jgi:hypothetical protein
MGILSLSIAQRWIQQLIQEELGQHDTIAYVGEYLTQPIYVVLDSRAGPFLHWVCNEISLLLHLVASPIPPINSSIHPSLVD